MKLDETPLSRRSPWKSGLLCLAAFTALFELRAGELRHLEVHSVLGQMYDTAVEQDDHQTFGLSIPRGTALARRMYPVRSFGTPAIHRLYLPQYKDLLLRHPKRNHTAYFDPASGVPANLSRTRVWTNRSGGRWSDPANWQGGEPPGPEDHVSITLPGTYNISLDRDATVASLDFGGATGEQKYILEDAVTLTLLEDSTIRENAILLIQGGTLAGPGNLDLAGPLECVNGARLAGSGQLILRRGGRIEGPSSTHLVGRTLVNHGLLECRAQIGTGSGSVIQNLEDGMIELIGDAGTSFDWGGVPGVLENAGIIRKIAVRDGRDSEIDDVIYGSGRVEVETGSLTLGRGGAINGEISIRDGAELRFGSPDAEPSPVLTMNSRAEISGPGNVLFQAGRVEVLGNYRLNGATVVGNGSANFRRSGLVLGSLLVEGLGVVQFFTDSLVVINSLDLSQSTLGGTDALTISKSFNWSGGGIEGSGIIRCNGSTAINGESKKWLSNRVLVNENSLLWTEGSLRTGNGSVVSNKAGAFMQIQPPATTEFAAGPRGAFLNAGSIRITQGKGLVILEDLVVNSGTIEIENATLRCSDLYQQTAGETRLDHGELQLELPLALLGGNLVGNGSIAGDLVNQGAVVVGEPAGRLTIAGDYSEATKAALFIDLGGEVPASGFDQLVVEGVALLAGSVHLKLVNGFVPPPESTYPFLLAGSRKGDFSRFMPEPASLGLEVVYSRNAVSLKALGIARPPEISYARTGGELGEFVLAWPQSAAGWILEFTPDLSASGQIIWLPVPAGLYQTNDGGGISCSQPIERLENRFFRLRTP